MLTSSWMGAQANPPGKSGFESGLAGCGRGRAWILTSSVLLHGAVLATLAGFQLWRVEAVAEPPIADVFEVQLPLPPLKAAPAATPAPEHAREQAGKPPRPTAIQPTAPQPATTPVAQPNLASIPERVPPPALVPLPADPPATTAADADRSGRDTGGDGRDNAPWGDRSGVWGNDRPLRVGGPISPPRIVPGTKVQPRYTEEARATHLQGVVVLQAVIDVRGNVVDVRILKDLPFGLGEEAVKAVNQWRFTPALLAGNPVMVWFELTVKFELR
jgi:TonB family protein